MFFVVVDVGAISFLSSENEAKNHFFSKNKLSGDIGLMIQMFNLIFLLLLFQTTEKMC